MAKDCYISFISPSLCNITYHIKLSSRYHHILWRIATAGHGNAFPTSSPKTWPSLAARPRKRKAPSCQLPGPGFEIKALSWEMRRKIIAWCSFWIVQQSEFSVQLVLPSFWTTLQMWYLITLWTLCASSCIPIVLDNKRAGEGFSSTSHILEK